MKTDKKAIVWFRSDLRLHDNEALTDALLHADTVLPVYVFDERVFRGETRFGFRKTDKFRAQFIIESVACLKENLINHGSDLIIRIGKPEEVITEIAREEKTRWIYCNRERTSEEVIVQDTLEEHLWSIGQEVRYSRGKMLYYTADLPFPVTHTPDGFTSFRKEVEKFTQIRSPLPIPTLEDTFKSSQESGDVPSLQDFNHNAFDHADNYYLKGGEDSALKELEYYFSEDKLASDYLETRNLSLGRDYSTKFSAYLSAGCLSPKYLYERLKAYEKVYGSNKSTYSIFFELLWRDFFRLIGKKYKERIFLKGGIISANIDSKQDPDMFEKWKSGSTGFPFIDASMRQLNHTGFMSNRGRQNVASFLIHELDLNWQLGASYFESKLIDYDPCSNYCNWNYIAGLSSESREIKRFNILLQSKKYDPDARFIKQWIPALSKLELKYIHEPSQAPEGELIKAGVKLGDNYPSAMINLNNSDSLI